MGRTYVNVSGYDEEVSWRLRVNVVEGDAAIVLVDDVGRDLLACDLREDRVARRCSRTHRRLRSLRLLTHSLSI